MPIETPEPAAPAAPPKGAHVPIEDAGPTDRATLAAELEAMEGSTSEPLAEVPASEPAAEPEPEEKPEGEAEGGDDKPIPETEEPASDDDAPTDPVLAKRLAAVGKAEKRAKELVARERAEIEKQRAELAPRLEAAEKFEQLAKRAKYDPASVLLNLGLTEEELDQAARDVYAASKAAAADPKLRAQSQKSMRERELADQVATLTKKMEDRDRRDQEREQQATVQREVGVFLDAVAKKASDETPIVRNMLAKNPEKTRERLGQVAEYLIETTGEVPDHADVVKTLEKLRREELEEAGIDVVAVLKSKKQTPVAGEKPAAKTLSSDIGTPTKPPAPRATPLSKREERDQLVRELEALDA